MKYLGAHVTGHIPISTTTFPLDHSRSQSEPQLVICVTSVTTTVIDRLTKNGVGGLTTNGIGVALIMAA